METQPGPEKSLLNDYPYNWVRYNEVLLYHTNFCALWDYSKWRIIIIISHCCPELYILFYRYCYCFQAGIGELHEQYGVHIRSLRSREVDHEIMKSVESVRQVPVSTPRAGSGA